MKEHFKNHLKELRTEKGYTQRKLAAMLHISHVSYLHWDQGKTEPSINNICELCKIFGVSADYLLGLEEETEKKFF